MIQRKDNCFFHGLLLLLSAMVLLLVPMPEAAARDSQGRLVILALGDSLTAGYGLGPGEAFPDQLQKHLRNEGHDVAVLNGGVSGDTASGGAARLDWALSDQVDMVIIELGANDSLRGVEPAITEAALDDILTRLGQKKLAVLLTGMLAPPNAGKAYADEFAAIYPRLASRHNVALYDFFLEGVAARPDLNQADGIHPTAAGVDEIVARIAPAVIKVMQSAP